MEGSGGTLKAKADDVDETEKSPISIEEGKTVTFTATPEATYRVKGWTLDGNAITEAGTKTEYKLKVSKPATVKVSFEAIPKHAITFSVDGANGTLTAKADGVDETEASPINVEEGKTVTFTAKADTGYRVKEWKVDDKPIADAGKSNTYAHIVTKVATITVSFELTPKHAITFSVDGANGKLTAKADGIDETERSPITVEEGKTVTFTAKANAGYGVKEWKVDDTAIQGNKENTYTHTVTKAVDIKVSFEIPSVEGGAVLILSPDKLTIKVKVKTADGSAITVEGCNEQTLASDTETTLTATGTKVVLKGNITEFNCIGVPKNKQSLTALNVQGLTALRDLRCSNNKLTELNVQGLTSLQELRCFSNQLPELNLQGLTSLQKLRCANNKFIELNVRGLTSLQRLNCSDNKLTELNVQGLTSLQGIACSNNKLTDLNVQDLTSLQVLVCSYNQLTELNVQGLTSLRVLNCYSNKLKAQAMTKILNALPTRVAGDNAKADLYTEKTGANEGNCKDYTQPAELKDAFEGAKKRKWKLLKYNASEKWVDI